MNVQEPKPVIGFTTLQKLDRLAFIILNAQCTDSSANKEVDKILIKRLEAGEEAIRIKD